jgi:2-polyprenyl-3-methyl-5-hydroxy-6-metoxy-1,4-benzoquinol methylase
MKSARYRNEAARYNEFYMERLGRLGRMPNPSQMYSAYRFRKNVYGFIKSLNTASRQKILDVGCGNGTDIIILNDLLGGEADFLGIELSEFPVKVANRYARSRKLKNIRFASGPFESFEFREEFDVVMCLEVIEHLPDLKEVSSFVGRLNKALKKGGYLILSTPNKGNVYRAFVRRCLPRSLTGKLFRYMHENAEVYTGLKEKKGHDYHPSAMSFVETRKIVMENGFRLVKAVRGAPHYGAEWIDRNRFYYLCFILLDMLIPQKFVNFGWNTISFWKKE